MKRELANRAQKASQRAQEAPAPRRRKNKKGMANGTQKPSSKPQPKQKQGQKAKQKAQPKGDFRPGRARRAEMQRSRKRSR